MFDAKNIIRSMGESLFGGYNGVQIFLAPLTLLYLLQSNSMLSSITSLFSFRIHYFPLLIFLVTLIFVLFMLVKIRMLYPGNMSEYIDKIVDLNISILAVVLIALIYYAISAFLGYFYGIKGILKPGLALLFKLFTTSLVLYHYSLFVWTKPLFKRGYKSTRASKALKAWGRSNKLLFAKYSLLIIVIVIASVRIYQFAMSYLLFPLLDGINQHWGVEMRFYLLPFNGISDVFINTLILSFAFLVANLFFYPIAFTINRILIKLNPLKTK
ncbi:MAG: hypothetical protein CVU50_04390 [Candidatus Cloacimonetes bacterium HGW-Cloacimonetes-3]|jgi:hypothetical protein|nr:MAG: hypothetical protein CVU50_04390 [Candidatus Cloacimonetes bacterium HGW-Cloacimonetes-3]